MTFESVDPINHLVSYIQQQFLIVSYAFLLSMIMCQFWDKIVCRIQYSKKTSDVIHPESDLAAQNPDESSQLWFLIWLSCMDKQQMM